MSSDSSSSPLSPSDSFLIELRLLWRFKLAAGELVRDEVADLEVADEVDPAVDVFRGGRSGAAGVEAEDAAVGSALAAVEVEEEEDGVEGGILLLFDEEREANFSLAGVTWTSAGGGAASFFSSFFSFLSSFFSSFFLESWFFSSLFEIDFLLGGGCVGGPPFSDSESLVTAEEAAATVAEDMEEDEDDDDDDLACFAALSLLQLRFSAILARLIHSS